MIRRNAQRSHSMQTSVHIDDSPLTADVSFAEERLWLADPANPTSLPFFECKPSMSMVARLGEVPNAEALEASLNDIVRRHEVLRSRFFTCQGRLVRSYEPSATVKITNVDLRELPEDSRSDRVKQVLADHGHAPFDLASAPLLRAILVRLPDDEHIFSVTVAHMVFDRWSKRVMALELKRFYEAHVTGQAPGLQPLTRQYRDYVQWQRHHLEGRRGRLLLEYWTTQLKGLGDSSLPYDDVREQPATTRSGIVRLTIPASDVTRLGTLRRRCRVTMATLMLAIVKVLLHRIGGHEDIAVGMPLTDRRRPEFEPLIGLFMNVVVARTTMTADLTFLEVLDRVRRVLVDASRHQDMAYGYLVRVMPTPAPLYRVLFNFLPTLPPTSIELPGIPVAPLSIDTEPSSLADISIRFLNDSHALACRVVYKADVFSPARMGHFAHQLQKLVSAILEEPAKPVGAYSLM